MLRGHGFKRLMFGALLADCSPQADDHVPGDADRHHHDRRPPPSHSQSGGSEEQALDVGVAELAGRVHRGHQLHELRMDVRDQPSQVSRMTRISNRSVVG
jgi:hypothetical protein